MSKIVQIQDKGENVYPITKPEAVVDSNKKNILELITETINNKIDPSSYLTKEEFGEASKNLATSEELIDLENRVNEETTAYVDKEIKNAIAAAITQELNGDFTYVSE